MAILDFIFPRICHVCGVTLSPQERGYVCTPCLAGLPRTLYHRQKGNPMEMRFAGLFPFERATGHFFYSSGSEVSQLIQDFKYRHFRGLARFMGETVGRELLSTGFFSDIDVIVPIPMHFLKKAQRGYNQTEEIAIGLSNAVGLPIELSLRARRSHVSQTSLSTQERKENLRDIFALRQHHSLDNKHVLLLDDVCTTGATLAEAVETIHRSCTGTRISMLTLGVTF
ncbi:MAG: ComF family protein [Muribaculaceae bacterium]|nr:ComF family protein [Muribaculaceae bacterium]